jgi:hypothetical protein
MPYLMTLSPDFTECNHRKIFVAKLEYLQFHCFEIDTEISRLTTGCNALRITRLVAFHCPILREKSQR